MPDPINLPSFQSCAITQVNNVSFLPTPTLVGLPKELRNRITHFLSLREIVSFSCICVAFFNARYKGPIYGLLQTQCWQKIPQLTDCLSSVFVCVGNEKRIIQKNDKLFITRLTLHFGFALSAQDIALIMIRLQTLTRLTTLHIDCGPRGANTVRLLLEAIVQLPLSLTHITLSHLSQMNMQKIFASLTLLNQLTTLTLKNYRGHLLPAGMAQLVNLQVLKIEGARLSTLPDDMDQLCHLKEIEIEGHPLMALPGAFSQRDISPNITLKQHPDSLMVNTMIPLMAPFPSLSAHSTATFDERIRPILHSTPPSFSSVKSLREQQ